MATTRGTDGSVENRIRTVISDAAVGLGILGDDVVSLGGIDVMVDGEAVELAITLPVAGETLREQLLTDLRRTALGVDGVSTVEVRWKPTIVDPEVRVDLLEEVKHVVAVASGKGGVGKSTVAANLAVALAEAGADVGLLDADVYGPNAPVMLGIDERTPRTTHDDGIVPWEAHGVSVMSMGFVVGEDDPIIWRGPMVDDAIEQLFRDVRWGTLDYLFVDLPPGTGDAQLSLVQHLPVSGAVVVTTPQAVAVDDARRGLRGFRRYDVPILGIGENMSGFECPDCGEFHDVFGADGADRLAEEFGVPVLGRLPLDPSVGTLEVSEEADRPGVSIPGLGRLQLPRTREERERSKSVPPIAVREDGGVTRTEMERLATRTAVRVEHVTTDHEDPDGRDHH